MKKILLLIFTLFYIFGTQGSSKPGQWICNIIDTQLPWPKKSEVIISFAEPVTDSRIDYLKQVDGSFLSSNKDYITASNISSWIAEKAKCDIQNGFKEGEFIDKFEYQFLCKGLQGSFSINFKDYTGFYDEELTSFHVRHRFSLENCKPSTD